MPGTKLHLFLPESARVFVGWLLVDKSAIYGLGKPIQGTSGDGDFKDHSGRVICEQSFSSSCRVDPLETVQGTKPSQPST